MQTASAIWRTRPSPDSSVTTAAPAPNTDQERRTAHEAASAGRNAGRYLSRSLHTVSPAGKDELWLDDLLRQNRGSVVRMLARYVGDQDIAEDLAQRTFLEAWRKRDKLDGNPQPWLFGIARNLARNHRRRERRWQTAWRKLCVDPLWNDEEIAGVVRISPQNVRQQRHRARAKLRAALSDLAGQRASSRSATGRGE